MNTSELIRANRIATHAYQLLRVLKSGEPPPSPVWPTQGRAEHELEALVEHQHGLISDGVPSAVQVSHHLGPVLASALDVSAPELPVNILQAWLRSKAPQATDDQTGAIATLLQMMLDIDRDGDVLQDMFRAYKALGLPIHLGAIGLNATDSNYERFAQDLSPKLGLCPFETDARTLKMLFQKLRNWGRRHTGERDAKVVAQELLAEADVQPLIPLVKKMPTQKICVIGHSYTMDVNWSSPSSFVPITMEIVRALNPAIQFKLLQRGGMSYAECRKLGFPEQALTWKPDRVLLVMLLAGRADQRALNEIVQSFTQAGIEAMVFDSIVPDDTTAQFLRVSLPQVPPHPKFTLLPAREKLSTAPNRGEFLSLDGIHMTEPYHRLMTKLWLAHLVKR
ncbi:MAG TPA: hypothetical protein VGP72_25290 [Planctomycetota bacterium]|jgi:hypothetical protein